MGAWGNGIFDDDSAMDFLSTLAESNDPLRLMGDAFDAVAESTYVEYDSAQGALVSAAAIDTIANGTRHADDLEDLAAWAKRNVRLDVSSLRPRAAAAVRRVLSDGSELRELWSENADEFPKWSSNLQALAKRLGG